MPLRLKRLGFAPTICPATRCLEDLFYPDASKIAGEAHEMVTGSRRSWPFREAKEILDFKGPF
jgi:pyruvate dehydrogenase E1 component beta subunit